jgi:hypothetical protein
MNVMQTHTCSLPSGTRDQTDLYLSSGRIGRTDLSAGCLTWHETLALVAADLTRAGAVAAVRARLKGRVTFLCGHSCGSAMASLLALGSTGTRNAGHRTERTCRTSCGRAPGRGWPA